MNSEAGDDERDAEVSLNSLLETTIDWFDACQRSEESNNNDTIVEFDGCFPAHGDPTKNIQSPVPVTSAHFNNSQVLVPRRPESNPLVDIVFQRSLLPIPLTLVLLLLLLLIRIMIIIILIFMITHVHPPSFSTTTTSTTHKNDDKEAKDNYG